MARDNLAQGQAALTPDLVSLYRALGGGWHEDAAVAEQASDLFFTP